MSIGVIIVNHGTANLVPQNCKALLAGDVEPLLARPDTFEDAVPAMKEQIMETLPKIKKFPKRNVAWL
jgi:hypothetical protein